MTAWTVGVAGLAALGYAALAAAVDVRWEPAQPSFDSSILIEIRGCSQEGILHWGVNPRGAVWETPNPAYLPYGTTVDGIAARTPLEGPDEYGICRVRLGPFNHPQQMVGTLAFSLHWKDGNWDNNGGADYQVPISSARISFEPAQPTRNDTLRVVVHRSGPNGFLRWGVNAMRGRWQVPPAVYWPTGTYAVGDGLAVDSPLSPPDEQGNSVIELGPFNQGAALVDSVHMAVHWEGNWDTDFGRNYNAPLTATDTNAPTLRWINPTNQQAVQAELEIELEAGALPVEVWLDGHLAATLSNSPLRQRLAVDAQAWGPHQLVARAVRDGRAAVNGVAFWLVPPYRVEPRPAGAAPGAGVMADQDVCFTLYAPGKHYVTLLGDFNGWDPKADVMNLDPDGTWWLKKNLAPGRHEYQYLVDGSRRLGDPYAHDITWQDENGHEDYRAENARAVLEVGAPPFAWQCNTVTRPPAGRLVVYEFHVQDFSLEQGFTGVMTCLDYVRDLGANAIEMLPVTEFPGGVSWGYNPAFHLAPESTFGTPAELKQLVDAAHARGLAVIGDLVLNHMDWNSALFQLYESDYDASPYFWLFLGDNWGFPDLEQESPAFKEYAAEVIRHWLLEYRMDGVRYDATRWVGWHGYNDWGAAWFAYAARQADPHSIQIAEHLPSDPFLTRNTEMDMAWDSEFRWRIRDMLNRASLDREGFERVMDARRSGFDSNLQRLAYTESHDEERVWRDLAENGFATNEILRRAEAAVVLTLTAPGPAMIYAGQEFGESTRKILWLNPLHWSNLEQPEYARLFQSTRRLLHWRAQHPVWETEDIAFLPTPEQPEVAVYQRQNGPHTVWAAVNFGRAGAAVSFTPPQEGAWWDVLEDRALNVSTGAATRVELEPGQAVVWSTRFEAEPPVSPPTAR